MPQFPRLGLRPQVAAVAVVARHISFGKVVVPQAGSWAIDATGGRRLKVGRGPQSVQSEPSGQAVADLAYSAPGPPSSQEPSELRQYQPSLHVSVQLVGHWFSCMKHMPHGWPPSQDERGGPDGEGGTDGGGGDGGGDGDAGGGDGDGGGGIVCQLLWESRRIGCAVGSSSAVLSWYVRCVAVASGSEATSTKTTESRTRPAEANEARTAGDTRAAATGAPSEWKV